MAVGGVMTGLADNYALIAVGRLDSGVGAVLQSLFMLKMVADWFDENSITTAMALLLVGWPVGFAFDRANLPFGFDYYSDCLSSSDGRAVRIKNWFTISNATT